MGGGGDLMEGLIDRARLLRLYPGRPGPEQVASALEDAILSGRLRVGERLPPVRRLSSELGMSGATIAAAYGLLNRRGWTRGEVGRGTFVVGVPGPPAADTGQALALATGEGWGAARRPAPWRRRALLTSASRLRAAYPQALDCTSGKPDVALLPFDLLTRAWHRAIDDTTRADLQYTGPEPVPALVRELLPRLEADGIPARGGDLVVGSSAQQFMVLAVSIIGQAADGRMPTVAVEEPGYQTAADTFERLGCRVVGLALDEQGVVPAALDAALADGVTVVLFIPRVQNPTGVSWSVRRVAELAEVLAHHPGVVAVEDDQFADAASARPGSLLGDRRIEDRVIYIRSFAKAIAPDLRLAVAVARARLRAMLVEAKSFADGWSSRLAQRALAHVLADPGFDAALAGARAEYALRRDAALGVLQARLHPVGGWASGADGINLWVHLPPGVDAVEVIERTAGLGVLVAPGEPFFIRPGHGEVVRISVGMLDAARARDAATALASAALNVAADSHTTISV